MEKISAIVSRVANTTYNHSRHFLPQQPWWNSLEPSFHKFPDDFYLDFKTQMMVEGTAALDIGLRTVMASLASVCCLPFTLSPKQLAEDYQDRFFYQKLGETHDPAQFFKKPTEKVTVRKSKSGRLDFQPEDGGICELLSFDSPFVAVNPKKREAYAKLKHNSTAWHSIGGMATNHALQFV